MDSKRLHESVPRALQHVRVVLVRPSHPGNIGAAARAMKTMGLSRLLLVQPKQFPDPQALAMACGADDVLTASIVCDSLAEALGDVVHALALTARRRELASEPQWARDAALALAQEAGQAEVAMVFGNETSGLSNQELQRCNSWAMVPTNPHYSSLNLAATVQLMCYEMRMALCQMPPLPRVTDAGKPATNEQVEDMLAHLEQTASHTGFYDPEKPRRLMQRMRRLFARARLESEEVNILRGFLASCQRPTGKRWKE